MRLLVCGSRGAPLKLIDSVTEVFRILKPSAVIHGNANGADFIGGAAAYNLGIPVEVFPADWEKHGNAAGPIRNQQMLSAKPDLGLAIYPKEGITRGTYDMVTRLQKAGVKVLKLTY